MRLLLLGFLIAASSASAQDSKTPPSQTKQDTKTSTKAAAPATKAPAGAQQRPGITIAPESTARAQTPVIMREDFEYDAAGRRDPFFSLLASAELRPSVSDLKLTSVLYHPTRPIAVMRDAATNVRYTVTLGTTLGRMRVIMIKPRVVIFTIEEFGLNRQDSLVLRDTTKARAR